MGIQRAKLMSLFCFFLQNGGEIGDFIVSVARFKGSHQLPLVVWLDRSDHRSKEAVLE